MTYRSASKLAGLLAIAVFLWLSPRLLATDCSCPKPKVKILALHTLTDASGVKVFFGDVEVPPDAEPVSMEKDTQYTLTVTIDPEETEFECGASISLTFPHCAIEYSRDSGTTWIRGSRTYISAFDMQSSISPNQASILIRITASASDSAMSSPAPGDEADPQSTPPSYTHGSPPVLAPPGLGLEIPMGTVLTPEGYRSAGVLVSYGPVSASSAAPSNLHYNAISAVSSIDVEYLVLNGNDIEEKHYVTPQGMLRVRGWNSTTQSAADWTGAAETLVEVYELGNYEAESRDEAETHGFSGKPHSYYRLEVVPVNDLASGFRLVQSNHGKVKIRSFQASADGLVLRDMKGARVTESIAPHPRIPRLGKHKPPSRREDL